MADGDYAVDGLTENAVIPPGMNPNYIPRTIVDNTLEIVDPTPNIFTLFIQFNKKFFFDGLNSVEVKWSNRMTSCAGICTYQPSTKSCVISLSAPLLKLRPRKDLVETLLHEMIHGYLFLHSRNMDRDGHGPEFQKHMNRINREAGTNITIYHTFHDEVRLYQQHWWRCDGPCQKRPPYFGMVRRASNRAPGKNDFWWPDHQRTCGGTFIKIKEPENFKSKKKKVENDSSKGKKPTKPDISKWFSPTDPKAPKVPQISGKPKPATKSVTAKPTQSKIDNFTSTSGVKKLGNSTNAVHGFGTGGPGSSGSPAGATKLGNKTNTVHGWGTGGPGSKPQSTKTNATPSSGYQFSNSGTLGGTGSGRSILLDKFPVHSSTPKKKTVKTPSFLDRFLSNEPASGVSSPKVEKTVPCPICSKSIPQRKINDHLDSCLLVPVEAPVESQSDDGFDTIVIDSSVEENPRTAESEVIVIDDYSECPVCGKLFSQEKMNGHVERCLETPSTSRKRKSHVTEIEDSPKRNGDQDKHRCLICNQEIDKNVSLNEHLEDCIGEMFNDDSIEDYCVKGKTEKTDEPEKTKFPCPVCMILIDEARMNEHLDTCLQ